MATRVGFIGLGTMGQALATNVVKGGFDLMVHDVREPPMRELAQLGAKVARSPREVGEHGEIIEIAVVDDAQVEAVTLGEDGILSRAKPGTVIAMHSTIHPKTVRKVAERAKAKGVGVVDAQMSGGEQGVRNKTLCFMVGGEKALFEKCRPVFAASGAHIFHVGELGMGAVAKAAQQTITCLNRLSAYEGMLLGEKAGLDLKVLQQIVHVTSAQSRIADHWVEQYRRLGDADRAHQVDLFYRGLKPALELAHELRISVPGLALVQQLFRRVLGIEKG